MKKSTLFIPYGAISEKEITDIKNNLTLKNPEYEAIVRFSKWGGKPKVPQFLKYYEEAEKGLFVPRNYPVNFVPKNNTVSGTFADIKFLGTLRKYQDDFYSGLDPELTDLVWEMPCGHGKTSMAIFHSSILKVKTLVLVPTNYLLKQWTERIEQFTGEKCYTATSSSAFIYNNTYNYYLFTLDMLLSIISNIECSEALAELLDNIGLTVLDEAHRTGADSYHPILNKLPSKWRLALTATFRRIDEREKILTHHFGKSYQMENQFPPAHHYALDTRVTIGKLVPKEKLTEDLTSFCAAARIPYHETTTYINYLGNSDDTKKLTINPKTLKLLKSDFVYAQLDNYVVEHAGRLKQVQSLLNTCIEVGRTVLVLSKRKEVLKVLYANYKDKCNCALVISDTNNMTDAERLVMQENCQIIFGINQLAQEGLDIDRLDTLITLHPIADTEQSIGRILRYVPDKKQAVSITLLDNHYSYLGLYRKSHKFVHINATIKGIIQLTDLRNKL